MPKKYLSKILKNGQVLYIKDAEARDSKQDKIDDLASIRSGAALGATAVQTETDPTVPAWAKASTKPTYTASEVGLGNVGNFKAVSTVASQGLTDTEKTNARNNIGAGTSSFSGSYTDLTDKPTIPNYSVMGASGSNHASGLVPDPGSTEGTTKFLREDGTWLVPAGGNSNNNVSLVETSTNLNNVVCPVTLLEGEEYTVIYSNTGTSTIHITVSTNYIAPSAEPLDLECYPTAYCEISYLKLGNSIFVRAL